jgi:hypothetical protein
LQIEKVHNLERGIVSILNYFDGWELEWCGGSFEHYDAIGKTPNGNDCVMEFKFRKKYYQEKMLEVYKYDKLMEMPHNIVKIYYVFDPKGNYMFWLNNLSMPQATKMYCPKTTVWGGEKTNKSVYLLDESQASIIQYNENT